MGIDILCLVFYAWGIYKGLSKGLLASVLILLGYVLAMILAVQWGSQLSGYLTDLSGKPSIWMPAVSFLIIFLGVILFVRVLIALVNKGADAMMLGWLNKLGGVFFYVLLYTLILIVLFYWLSYIPSLKEDYLKDSFCFRMLHDKMPTLIQAGGKVWPALQTAFSEMERLLH
jgi:membrane protein required for colicin V production